MDAPQERQQTGPAAVPRLLNSASHLAVQMFAGVASARITSLFADARSKANALLQAHFGRVALKGDLASDQAQVRLWPQVCACWSYLAAQRSVFHWSSGPLPQQTAMQCIGIVGVGLSSVRASRAYI